MRPPCYGMRSHPYLLLICPFLTHGSASPGFGVSWLTGVFFQSKSF